MELIGHRGVMGEVPQNTLPSFEAALKAGVPMIELDTDLASTGEVVIFHDDELNQITRGKASGPVSDHSFEELRSLNVNDGFDDGNVYQIPTLQEVLDLVDTYAKEGKRTKVNVELKAANTAEPVAKIVQDYLAKGWRPEDIIVSSFRHDELEKFKKLMPQIEIAVLIDDKQWEGLGEDSDRAVDLTKTMGGVAVNPGIGFVTKDLVDKAHAAGLAVNVWTVKTQEDYDKLAQMGVDAVFANTLNLKTD